MQEHVDGSPVVAEVNTSPTLYGWQPLRDVHRQSGDRRLGLPPAPAAPAQSEVVTERVADVQSAYATTDPDVAYGIFSRYGAAYVVVGPLERAYFPEGTAKWARAAGRFWTLVYRNPGREDLPRRAVSRRLSGGRRCAQERAAELGEASSFVAMLEDPHRRMVVHPERLLRAEVVERRRPKSRGSDVNDATSRNPSRPANSCS